MESCMWQAWVVIVSAIWLGWGGVKLMRYSFRQA